MDAFIPRNTLLLIARFGLTLLFLVMGWSKLTDFSAAVSYMVQSGAPLPTMSAVAAIGIEIFGGLALLAGLLVEPIALLLAFYTIATGFIGHHFWTMSGLLRYDMMIHFYKNISIAGGLLALAAAGPGRFKLSFKRR
ncbi:DoxX family protein [Neokomagataea thailandica NBRC 106555]|uniref:DoxX family protein n=2 Tax=Neokomagataea TaxID=1223423 RepID=A0A4Y6V7H7_9PROT|nr:MULTISPECIES: DoxX family protein [Neokomagataea]QDH24591.1 DoxX family protein [Neokomagataea tanensis]GBR54961.1 DoxX family protein [Neokomagataea thailandica NBRC 106555]